MTVTDFELRKERIKKLANDLVEEIEALSGPVEPKISVKAERKNDHVLLHLFGPVKEIQFSIGGGKWHSIQSMQKNLPKNRRPPAIDGSIYRIGNAANINQRFDVKVGDGVWHDKQNRFIFKEGATDTDEVEAVDTGAEDESKEDSEPIEKPRDPKPLLTTLWDSEQENFNSGFNAVRTRDYDSLEEMEGKGKFVIHSLSHTWEEGITVDGKKKIVLKSPDQWRSQLRSFAKEIEKMKKYNADNFRLFIQDEGMGKPWFGKTEEEKVENLELLAKIAKEELPEWVKIGISETRGAHNRGHIAQGYDFYVTPAYYFFRKDLEGYGNGYFIVDNREQFDERFEKEIKIVRENVGDAEIYMIGQGFFNTGSKEADDDEYRRRWRKAPLWYPAALYDNCNKHNVQGVWWWLLKSNDRRSVSGLGRMPELYDEVKKTEKIYS